MRTFDTLYRTTVGFDRLFDMLDSGTRPDWPPYNIEKVGENDYRIAMAIAGFSRDEVELTQHGPEIVVVGQKADDQSGRQLLHQGLAYRSFRQSFRLADHMKIKAANLENGLLTIDIVREIPLVRGHKFVKFYDRIQASRLVVAMIPRYKLLP